MLTALVLASLAQFQVIVEQSESVVYELPVVQTTTYREYSSVSVIRPVPTVTYSLPSAYYLRSEPLMPLFSFPMGAGRMVIKERWPGFRGKVILRY